MIDIMNETLPAEERLVSLLISKGLHIACAESCTGGLVSASIVNVPDASKVMDLSIVTYANEAKIRYLGVSEASIKEFGVVSPQVAGQMAEGIAHAASCEIGVATSGIAGPGGGTETKPVGLVCFGFYIKGRIITSSVRFGNIGRNNVRAKSTEYALETLIELLLSSDAM